MGDRVGGPGERAMSAEGVFAGVSVVLVHTAAEPVTEPALAALDVTRWPGGDPDVVVVDCEPGTAGRRAWSDRRGVQVVRADEGTGLAGARNLGAEVASGQYVAFLAAGARPSRDWLVRAVEVLESDGSVTCVAPGVAGAGPPAISFAARPTRSDGSASGGDVDVLHPPTEAAVVRAQAFRDVGGFDERYERFGEEIDLGWRLWLLGHRVRACATAEVSLAGVAAPAVSPARRRFLEERNALSTIFKHYDATSLAYVLPAAMALAVRAGGVEGDEELLASARGIDAFVEALPELQRSRSWLQDARQRTDQELVRLFRLPLQPPRDAGPLATAHRAVVDAFGLVERFGHRRRIVVATADVLTPKMAGPAIRAWQIASALSVEHEVQLVTTSSLCELSADAFVVRAVDDDDLPELEAWCDALVVQGFILEGRPVLRSTRKVMVVDLYDPLHLEQLELTRDDGDAARRGAARHAMEVLNFQLSRGDFFICASPKQRDFWLGQMSGLGRINPLTYDEDETLESLITVVPFGLPDDPPIKTRQALKGQVPGIGEDDEVILWGGGIYNWFDPLTLVKAVDLLRRRRPQVRLFFMGLRHPNPEVREMRMAVAARRLSDELGLTGTHVFFNEGWVAYDDRKNYLLEADVGVSTHLDHVETAFSFRTRILDYLWATLPVVATGGDAFADLIENEKLGVTVPAGDVEALEEALFRVLDDQEFAALCRKNLASVRPRFTWSQVLRPLVEFCREPRRSPDLVDPQLRAGPVAPPVEQPRWEWRRDVRIALAHLRHGGPSLLAARARSRLSRAITGRR